MRPRPLVDMYTSEPPDRVLGRFRDRLKAGGSPVEGHVGKREMSFVLAGETRHVFSPWLSLEAREWEQGTRLRGVFGPHPNLWTLFVFVYATWVFVFIGGLIYGYGQWITQESPTGVWVAAGAVAGQSVSCTIDLVGRAIGRRQMDTIRLFLKDQLPEAVDVSPDVAAPK